jgi:ribosomal protein L37AE/L43A
MALTTRIKAEALNFKGECPCCYHQFDITLKENDEWTCSCGGMTVNGKAEQTVTDVAALTKEERKRRQNQADMEGLEYLMYL